MGKRLVLADLQPVTRRTGYQQNRGRSLDTSGAEPYRLEIIAGELCPAVDVHRLKRTYEIHTKALY